MKKILTLFVLVLASLTLVGCSSNLKYKQNLTTYNIEAVFDDQTKILQATQMVKYINTEDTTLDCVKFHLYANAFRENAKATVVSLSNQIKAYPNGKSYGDIQISTVNVNGESCEFTIAGEDENILQVPLNAELFPDDSVEISMQYTVNLANVNHRLGYGENAINLCNFYPIACVYENGDFVCDMYNANGDPFYSEVADYNVKITYPNSLTIASTGNQLSCTQENNQTTTIISANCVRDFGIVLSDKFTQKSEVFDQRITINYLSYGDENVDKTMSLIKDVLLFFEEKIGEYPYSQVSVVETNFVHGGMEYPNLVLISDSLADYESYQMVVIHELCHQWWYGVVGNNQFDYGWIDEGLTEFCTIYFYEKHPSHNRTMEQMVNSSTNSYLTFAKVYKDVQGEVDTSMNRALDQFATEPEYVYNTYVKGMLMFATVYEIVGEKPFVNALKYYYKTYAFEESTPADVIKCFSKGTGRSLENLFNAWLEGKVKIVGK